VNSFTLVALVLLAGYAGPGVVRAFGRAVARVRRRAHDLPGLPSVPCAEVTVEPVSTATDT
jgi:hypothetical protein